MTKLNRLWGKLQNVKLYYQCPKCGAKKPHSLKELPGKWECNECNLEMIPIGAFLNVNELETIEKISALAEEKEE